MSLDKSLRTYIGDWLAVMVVEASLGKWIEWGL